MFTFHKLIDNGKRRAAIIAKLLAEQKLPPLPSEPTYCRSGERWTTRVDKFGGRPNVVVNHKPKTYPK